MRGSGLGIRVSGLGVEGLGCRLPIRSSALWRAARYYDLSFQSVWSQDENYVDAKLVKHCLTNLAMFDQCPPGCAGAGIVLVQRYLAHKKHPSPLGPPKGPRHSPTVGS